MAEQNLKPHNENRQKGAGFAGPSAATRLSAASSFGPERAGETVALHDSTTVLIRAIRPDDAQSLQALFARLSTESIWFRFLGHPKELSYEQGEQLATADDQTGMALVATREQCGE